MGSIQTAFGDSVRRFVTTKGGKPTSFDPLHADSSENFHTALMMYLTPIELSINDELRSTLLSSFEYDPSRKTMRWVAKDGPKYSDGSKVTPEDIAFSVSRMAFTRPTFPILKDIVGLKEWLASPNPLSTLPSGITIKGQTIEIVFERNVRHPIARFVLTTFSVIPKKCVDLKKNELTCSLPPASGYYQLKSQEQSGSRFSFERRQDYAAVENKKIPDQISIEYWSPNEVMKNLPVIDEHTVIRTHESAYDPQNLTILKAKTQQSTRNGSSFGCFNLNPLVEPFQDVQCRRAFVNLFRKEYQKLYQSSLPLETSLFTRLLPGYLDQSNFPKLDVKNEFVCLEKMKNNPPIFASLVGHNDFTLFTQTMLNVYKSLGIADTKPVEIKERKEMRNLFLSGKIALFVSSSQFWELDPGGDLKMFLTPKMHPPLKFVTEDSHLQGLLSKIDSTESPLENRKFFEDVNRYVYEQSLLNVYSHFQMLLVTKKGNTLDPTKYSLTITKPWDVFR